MEKASAEAAVVIITLRSAISAIIAVIETATEETPRVVSEQRGFQEQGHQQQRKTQDTNRHMNLRKSPGHRPGVPMTPGGTDSPVFWGFPVFYWHRPGVPGVQGVFRNFMRLLLMCVLCSFKDPWPRRERFISPTIGMLGSFHLAKLPTLSNDASHVAQVCLTRPAWKTSGNGARMKPNHSTISEAEQGRANRMSPQMSCLAPFSNIFGSKGSLFECLHRCQRKSSKDVRDIPWILWNVLDVVGNWSMHALDIRNFWTVFGDFWRNS